jgi:hypothetical protein
MKIAIIGSRSFNDLDYAYDKFEQFFGTYRDACEYHKGEWDIEAIISGGAKGADSIAEKIADITKIELIVFLPDWNKYGKGAGFIRNEKIISECDVVLAFWDGSSHGTAHSLKLAKQLKRTTIVVYI